METVKIIFPYGRSVRSKNNKMEFLVDIIFPPILRNESE